MNDSHQKLKMSFDPNTIEHLGVKMYSRIPSAIAELIANAYDAGARRVDILLYDTGEEKSIVVQDDGYGMTFDEINSNFLRIGRNRREEGATKTLCGTRKATGKKGLGKLALFGIGSTIKITTIKKDSGLKTTFTLNWDSIKATPGQQDYEPDFITEQCNQSEQGTIILLKNIKRNTPYNKEDLAISLSKLFNCFDETFKCFVSLNGDAPYKIDSQLRYKSIEKQEFIWQFPEFSNNLEDGYKNSCLITGKIISTEKPLRPGLRGITLFANGRLVNQPEFFGVSESNIGFSYLTGWLNVDFVDDYENDVIATNRQSLNWDETGMPELRAFLQKSVRKIERDRREKRNKKRRETIKEKSEINIDEWYNKLPDNVLTSVVPIVNEIVDDSEISNEKQAKLVKNLYSLVPEYPYYHWRHIHTEVQDASKFAYQNNDYYTAFTEAVKRYVNKVKSNTKNLREDDDPLMGMVFGVEKGKPKLLSVTQKYKRPDGSNFNNKTLENIENGQRVLSQGVIKGCRNPIAHEEHNDLRESGLFSEKDCLDALSILSHLFRRLEDAIEIRDKEK